MGQEILFPGAHADASFSAPPLIPILGDGRPLDVAGVADRDRHILFGDQVLDAELALRVDDLGAPRVAVGLLDLSQLLDDNFHQEGFARQDRAQPCDGLQQLGQLVDDLLALESRETLQLHVENRLRLLLR